MTDVVLFLYALGGVLLLAAAAALVRAVRLRDGSSLKSRALPAALALFGSAFCLRLAAGLGAAYVLPMDNALDDLRRLASGFEIVGDSLVHAMQTFSMDEDYTLYLLAGKEMLTQLGLPAAAVLYGFVSAVVNVAAPIAGGAILLDILCDFFPVLRYQLNRSSTRFVFNELNEASIQLAESIHQRQRATGGSYGIVFANTALDREDERENQLFARAQAIGAFCFTANLPEFSLRGRLPGPDFFILHDIIGRCREAGDPAVRKGKRAGMGKPVRTGRPPGRSREILLCPQAGTFAVHNQRSLPPIGSIQKSRQKKTGIFTGPQRNADHAAPHRAAGIFYPHSYLSGASGRTIPSFPRRRNHEPMLLQRIIFCASISGTGCKIQMPHKILPSFAGRYAALPYAFA